MGGAADASYRPPSSTGGGRYCPKTILLCEPQIQLLGEYKNLGSGWPRQYSIYKARSLIARPCGSNSDLVASPPRWPPRFGYACPYSLVAILRLWGISEHSLPCKIAFYSASSLATNSCNRLAPMGIIPLIGGWNKPQPPRQATSIICGNTSVLGMWILYNGR